MTTSHDDSTTIREVAPLAAGAPRGPFCWSDRTFPKTARVVSLDAPVTIGRGRNAGRRRPRPGRGSHITFGRRALAAAPAHRQGRRRLEGRGPRQHERDVRGRAAREEADRRCRDGSIVLFGGHAGVFRRVSDTELAAIEEEAAAPLGPVATMSPALAVTAAGLRRLAAADASLLFAGETGVGKEVYARAVHAVSGRTGAFVAINCAALPAELVESELFGYARGAHSTATAAKRGLVELADNGTLLLDEIGDMPARLQAKLFRFLQDRQVLPLGSTRTRRVDVRVMAATSQPVGVAAVGPGRAAGRRADPDPAAARARRGHRRAGGALRRRRGSAGWSRRRSGRCACTTGRATCASWTRS